MPRSASVSFLITASALFMLLSGATASLAQERVGVTSAVNPEATGMPLGSPIRRLVIGQKIIFDERITTAESGQTQLLFLDGSSITIGPNSDLTINQFVYDPKSGTGKLVMSATRGLLRFIGGKLSKQNEGVVVHTNSATLSIRGGVFFLNQPPNGSLEAVFIYGRSLTVTGTTGASETLLRPGYAVTVARPGAAPSQPFPVPPADLASFLAQLDGQSGRNGGASVVPTDQMAASSGIEHAISGGFPTTVQQMGYMPTLPSQQLLYGQVQTTANSFNLAVNPHGTILETSSPIAGQIGTASAEGSSVGPSGGVATSTSISSTATNTVLPAATPTPAPAASTVQPVTTISPAPATTISPAPAPTPMPPPSPTPAPPPIRELGSGPFGHGSGPFGHGSGPFGHAAGHF